MHGPVGTGIDADLFPLVDFFARQAAGRDLFGFDDTAPEILHFLETKPEATLFAAGMSCWRSRKREANANNHRNRFSK
jgi:hypothetical protein